MNKLAHPRSFLSLLALGAALASAALGLPACVAGDIDSADDAAEESTAEAGEALSWSEWTADTLFPGFARSSPAIAGRQAGGKCLVHQSGNDNSLRGAAFLWSWSTDNAISNQSSGKPPAIGALGSWFYMVHQGGSDGATDLWFSMSSDCVTWYRPNGTWSQGDIKLNVSSTVTPALAEYGGLLHMAYMPTGSNTIAWKTFNGSTWGSSYSLPGMPTNVTPAMTAYNGKLYLMYKDPVYTTFWLTTYNGSYWTFPTAVPSNWPGSAPSITTYGGYLHLVYKEQGTSNVMYSKFDGTTWTTGHNIPGHTTLNAPSIAGDPSELVLLHDSADGTKRLWFSEMW